MPAARPEGAVEGLGAVWGSLVELGRALDPEEFELPTECPGWTVKDQFSHVIGTELLLEGLVEPPAPAPLGPHVRNELGALNERFVAARRPLAGPEVVEELARLARRRLVALRRLEAEVCVPADLALAPYVDYAGVRTVDAWVHEQDVRRATGRPGGRGGPGERATLDRMEASLAWVLAARVAPRPGTTVRVEVVGRLGRPVQLEVRGDDGSRRAVAVAVLDGPPTATLRLGEEAFVRRCCGRASASAVLDAPGTALAGDADLARALVAAMVVVA